MTPFALGESKWMPDDEKGRLCLDGEWYLDGRHQSDSTAPTSDWSFKCPDKEPKLTITKFLVWAFGTSAADGITNLKLDELSENDMNKFEKFFTEIKTDKIKTTGHTQYAEARTLAESNDEQGIINVWHSCGANGR